ncbi:hypothetical protein ARTHRO8AJ_40172 [Arthrobacter sp. 8AJ]|nr:hypothetical protein ARTHRO8AJ_40172 [Arthrobacter sp. 8AJ]
MEGIHVCSVTAAGTGLVLRVETAQTVSGSPDCGIVAIGHGRRPSGSMTPVFRPSGATAPGQASLAVPGPGSPKNRVHRRARVGLAPGRTHCQDRDMGGRRPAAFRHLGLRPGPPAPRLLAHCLGRHQGRSRPADHNGRQADRSGRSRR